MQRCRFLLVLLLLLGACREADGPADPSANSPRVLLNSIPGGAEIFVDSRGTDRRTPDTVQLRVGDRRISLRLDTAGFLYDFAATLRIEPSDSVRTITLPLAWRCANSAQTCITAARRFHDAGGMRFAASGAGSMFYSVGNGQGLFYPAGSSNSYVSSGMPVLAGLSSLANRAVAIGVFDHHAVAGLPVPEVTRNGAEFQLLQRSWIAPPLNSALSTNTVRGIEVEQRVIARDDVEGVLVLRVTFRNISDTEHIRAYAPHMPPDPVTYSNTWIGYALDGDVGTSSDDLVSYDPAMNMVYTYDASFSEPSFGFAATAPGLLGLRVLSAPPGTNVLLNSWRVCPSGQSCANAGDWVVGSFDEQKGYNMLTGSSVYSPDHADPYVGHLPTGAADMRMSVTAGPLTLAPGDVAEIVIAIAVAPPRADAYNSGDTVDPGDPFDIGRGIHAVAENLRARMTAAEALAGN